MAIETGYDADEAAWRAYANSLPGKRIGVGCLLFDEPGRLLIVNPTYKPGWSIPGGAIDADESPYRACRRELEEELGVELDPGRLVCVDYIGAKDGSTENIQFLFDGGTIQADVTERIVLHEGELSQWRFVPPADALTMLRRGLGKRLKAVIEAPAGDCLYLEDGEQVA